MDINEDEHATHHRWTRFTDTATRKTNHWCIDGDTGHHDEPCKDAEARTGDHATDTIGPDEWPTTVDITA
jgi:hypothetical protein